jgi:AcrR family transcriptional regulator
MSRSGKQSGDLVVTRNNSSKGLRDTRRRREPSAEEYPLVRTAPMTRNGEVIGLRERKKARLRQQIIDTSIRFFRERGYENTRIDDIVDFLEISQPTFFRYFPSKGAVLHDAALRAFAYVKEGLEQELSRSASTAERLHERYRLEAKQLESDLPLWRAIVLSGVMDPVRSPEVRQAGQIVHELMQQVLIEGQKRGEITRAFPADYLADFMRALCTNIVRRWSVGLPGPHSLSERLRSAVEFFLRGAQP